MKKINWTLIIIFSMVLACGKKYPLPPEPKTGMPSEESYLVVSNTSWDFTRFTNLKDILWEKMDTFILWTRLHF